MEEYRERLEKLGADQSAKLVLEKGDDPKDLRKAVKASASLLNRRIRSPFRGEEGSLSVGKRAKAETPAADVPKKRRGRPRMATT